MAAAGAMAGKAKNDRANEIEKSDRNLAAETARYSPWTGMAPGQIRRSGSMFGDVAQGALSGAMMGSQFGGGGMGGAAAAPMAGGGGMGAQEMNQQMSPWEQLNQQGPRRPMFGQA